MNWLIQLALIVIVARLAGILSRRIGVSALFGEILFGIILGTLAIRFHWQFDTHLIEILSEIGIIFLIFMIGLDTNVRQVLSVGFKGTLVAVLGVVFPFIGGFLLSRWFGYSVNVSLFVGACMTATSVAITSRVFMDLKFTRDSSAQTVLVAAVVDDVLGLLVLAGVLVLEQAGTTQGGTGWMLQIIPAGVYLFIFIPLMWLLTNPIYQWISRWEEETKFVLAIGLLFVVAYLADMAGLAPIVGAFFLGLAFSSKKDPHFSELSLPIYLFLAPIFFVYMGFQVNISALWHQSILALILIGIAIATKWFGAALAVLISKGSWKEANVVGIGMVPRGEVGLIIAALGKKMGVIDDALFGAVTLMCIVTTLITPLPLRLVIEKIKKK